MQHLFGTVITLLAIFTSLQSHGGAVSAGGRLRSASMECLFLDPAAGLAPYSFTAFDLREAHNFAVLAKVNLQTEVSSLQVSFSNLSVVSKGSLEISGISEDLKKLRILVQDLQPITPEQYMSEFREIANLPHIHFPTNVTGFRSEMTLNGASFHGICAKQYLFFYESRH